MSKKEVKIIGFSVKENFGILKATELKFDKELRLIAIKGEVGAGKTTLQKGLKLTTQGSNTLVDKTLYGDNVFLETQLLDGEKSIFVGCKSDESGSLSYFLYEVDENGKKVANPIIDGVKATPANYLKELQTALTWRLPEFTSENPTTVRNILLELYSRELEEKGVVFDKKSSKYVDGIIDQIEKAKEKRSYLDMKRKEVGGIADDMLKKGIDYENRWKLEEFSELEEKKREFQKKIDLAEANVEQAKESALDKLKLRGIEIKNSLVSLNNGFKQENAKIKEDKKEYDAEIQEIKDRIQSAKDHLGGLKFIPNFNLDFFFENQINKNIKWPELDEKEPVAELSFNDQGTCTSKPEEFFENKEVFDLLTEYREVAVKFKATKDSGPEEIDTSEFEGKVKFYEGKIEKIKERNNTAIAVNAYHDWKEQNEFVNSLNRDYFMKLTEINTGVEGLHICPEYTVDDKGDRIAKGNDIYLMYDGSYDKKYFNNPEKELRKLSSYSDTQKPVICLLIQNYLLSRKSKVLPYLWIDQVPIDKKTKQLLDKMSEDLGLWLFVNWTGDFDSNSLEDGEILIENGEVFFKED